MSKTALIDRLSVSV